MADQPPIGSPAVVKCNKMLAQGKLLDPNDVKTAMTEIMAGSTSPLQLGGFLMGLKASKQTTPEIIAVCAAVMLDFAAPITHGHPTSTPQPVVDIVGTGGDGMDTFNVSTTAGIVMAACGITVAKHGNRSSSGNVGSADFLEALGANIDLDGEQTAKVIEGCGYGFLFARKFHPAMKNVAAVRKELGVPTVFNLLGPLTNPARPGKQVTGVGARELGPVFAELLRLQGNSGLIVHATDGLDEISPSAQTDVWEVSGSPLAIKEYQIGPSDFGLEPQPLSEVSGGSADERVSWFRDVLNGKAGAVRNFIIMNAAAGLYVGGVAKTFLEAAKLAAEAIDSKRALEVTEKYISLTNQVATAGPTSGPKKSIKHGDAQRIKYTTPLGVRVVRDCTMVDGTAHVEQLIDELDHYRGMLMSSSYEYPGRYTKWDRGFAKPPLCIVAAGRNFSVTALNNRGKILLGAVYNIVSEHTSVESLTAYDIDGNADNFKGIIVLSEQRFSEEDRSRQPSIFSIIRAIIDALYSSDDAISGLYGAFSYDLAFQFEKVKQKHTRPEDQRDIVLYIPDAIITANADRTSCFKYEYDFEYRGKSTVGLARTGEKLVFKGAKAEDIEREGDHTEGQYADKVRIAREKFHKGDLFEAVLSQTFYRPCPASPSVLFRWLRVQNPAPYCFLISLGDDEWLVGASPEMYVRVEKDRVETCPISGTIKRGKDAVADASQILELLNSKKEESELTMCTDVDRNDKSRICVPGSVKVIARRQIEKYSRLIHTVDHVEGRLRKGFDALDAFLCHTWAVTVTGAPKVWAMQFVEDQEESPRAWYAGAVGMLNFDRNMDTGLTLRTIRIKSGVASVRAGATLLWDSDPDAEEQETRLKASAFLDALSKAAIPVPTAVEESLLDEKAPEYHVLLIDHEDSFVHTLANYVQQCGATMTTMRTGFPLEQLDTLKPDMVLMSPGPGCPEDFNTNETIKQLLKRNIPIFGVCLGLQALVQYFGGQLDVLPTPVHGKPASVFVEGDGFGFKDMPSSFTVARYHSIYANNEKMPSCLKVTARTEDGIVMAIEHKELPICAVQFHPESILTAHETGIKIIQNCIKQFTRVRRASETQDN
eukprot:m.230570 g.230570  ORF g.230570 m.230570 type:complete len:1104 (+) comp33583_c0_seq1:63-3374(+)